MGSKAFKSHNRTSVDRYDLQDVQKNTLIRHSRLVFSYTPTVPFDNAYANLLPYMGQIHVIACIKENILSKLVTVQLTGFMKNKK